MLQSLSISNSEPAAAEAKSELSAPARFFRKLIFMAPLILFIVFVNGIADPSHIFSKSQYERGMADALLKHDNLANVVNYNDRLVQKFYIERLKKAPDIIVLGSSRGMEIDHSLFPHSTFFNHCVTQGTLEDECAVYGMYRAKGLKPKIVILAVDPWLLRQGLPLYWKTIERDYNAFMTGLGFPAKRLTALQNAEDALQKYWQLISPSYFQQSVFLLINIVFHHGRRDYYPTLKTADEKEFIKLSDGSLSYSGVKRGSKVTAEEIEASVQRFQDQNQSPPIPDQRRRFERFIQALQKDHVRVILFLAPFHPQMSGSILNRGPKNFLSESENYFFRLSRRLHIKLLSSYNPANVGGRADEFYDPIHPKPALVKRIFGTLKKVKLGFLLKRLKNS